MSPVLKHFVDHTHEATELHRRLQLLRSVLEEVLFDAPQQLQVLSPDKKRAKAVAGLVSEADEPVFTAMSDSLWQDFSTTNLAQKMKALQAEAEALPVMTLYIPVVFESAQIEKLSAWVRSKVASGMLLTLEVDPKVVGGCAFVYKDTHFDWSLRRYLRAKRGLITTLLNAYGH